MIIVRYEQFDINFAVSLRRLNLSSLIVLLSSCGPAKKLETDEIKIIGFLSDYDAPLPSYDEPQVIDPYFKKLEPTLVEPYWISALEMHDWESVIDQMLEHDRLIEYSFPKVSPDYLPVTILGWAPASQNMISASREIFSRLEEVLNVRIEESETPDGLNNFVIAQSIQAQSSGLSYFPNNYFEIGSDIFISKDYSSPLFLNDNLTNYEYEVLVHEIGHALGLKHPFEGDRNNFSILNIYEDQTKFTAMSYDDIPSTFDGSFRVLDWMTLTKFYGVNPEFRSNNDVYKFDEENGVFIIDGNGLDTVSMPNSAKNIFLDLRVGTHSYQGQESMFITDANQLTISNGSDIENAETGFGDDTIIGNWLPNIIKSADGDDHIFAGEGADIIYPGLGNNTIDLSEVFQASDRIVIETNNEADHFDTIYGFIQGIMGDKIDLTSLHFSNLTFLPLVDALNVPPGYIDNCLVRVFGEGLADTNSLKNLFQSGGDLQNLELSSDMRAIVITCNSQNTGEIQNLYSVENSSGTLEFHQMYHIVGNYLDIDLWLVDNFII